MLARIYRLELSGSEQIYSRSTSDGAAASQQYTQNVDSFISGVSLSGYEIIKKEVIPINGKIDAFVLIKLPFAKTKDMRKSDKNGVSKKNH